MTALLWYYFAAILLLAAGFTGLYLYFKKKQKTKIHWGMFFLGIIVAVAVFLIILLLFRLTFKPEYYYNTPFFRTLVGFVFLALLALLRMLIVRSALYNRYKEAQGDSFCFGFGAAPGLFLGIYLLIMLPVVGFNGLFNGPCQVAEEGYLTFADNTIITVFRPAAGHLSFAAAFLSFAILTVAAGGFLRKISTQPYRTGVMVLWTVFAIALESAAILPLPFFAMYGLKHWQFAIWSVVLAAIQIALVRFFPKIQEESTYTKQFE